MPSPEARELAQLLVRKAEGDETVLLKLLDDSEIPDELLGFHLQQAVEKRLKAVLALYGVEYERTHSVSYLTTLIEGQGIELPESRDRIDELTPWAVAARYDDSFDAALDREGARGLLANVRAWSRRYVNDVG